MVRAMLIIVRMRMKATSTFKIQKMIMSTASMIKMMTKHMAMKRRRWLQMKSITVRAKLIMMIMRMKTTSTFKIQKVEVAADEEYHGQGDDDCMRAKKSCRRRMALSSSFFMSFGTCF
jgi:hypothetical protein